MDQPGPGGPRGTGWLAWAVASLVLAGAVSAGVLKADDDRPGSAIVSAARDQSGIDVTSTVTVPIPTTPPTPTSTSTPAATTTTLPKAAVDVLKAIGGSTTSTRRPTTTTTRPPAAPTTTVPAPTTTPTTVPAPFRATFVNEHPRAVVLIVNGGPFSLAAGQTIADVELAFKGGDVVQVRLAEDAKCGVSDSGEIFKPGGTYRVAIVVGQTQCKDFAVPVLRIAPQ